MTHGMAIVMINYLIALHKHHGLQCTLAKSCGPIFRDGIGRGEVVGGECVVFN